MFDGFYFIRGYYFNNVFVIMYDVKMGNIIGYVYWIKWG